MGGAIKSAGGAVSSVLGGIGANKAAKQQQKYQDKAMNQSREGYNNAVNWVSPYEQAGRSALEGLKGIAGQPIDRNASLAEYFASPEYQMMGDQARNQILRSSQATGGLGSTATGNLLSSIAPTLGQNYLTDMTNQQQNMYGQLMGLSGFGAEAANALGNYAIGQGNNMAGMYQQKGQIMASKAAIPWQTAATANQQVANSFGNLFSPQGWLGGEDNESKGRFGGLY